MGPLPEPLIVRSIPSIRRRASMSVREVPIVSVVARCPISSIQGRSGST